MRQHQPPLRVLARRQVALRDVEQFGHQRGRLAHAAGARITAAIADVERVAGRCQQLQEKEAVVLAHRAVAEPAPATRGLRGQSVDVARGFAPGECLGVRSEEHTSELQSLMRISYAVFCLKKKKTNTRETLTT